MGRVDEVIHGGVGNKLMLIHCSGVGRVDELHNVIKRQGVSEQGIEYWAQVLTDYGMILQCGRQGWGCIVCRIKLIDYVFSTAVFLISNE